MPRIFLIAREHDINGNADVVAERSPRYFQAQAADGSYRQCQGGKPQRAFPEGMPERALVLVLGRCSEQDRGPAEVLQREPSPLRTAVGDTRRIRPSGNGKRLDGRINDAGNLHSWTVLIPVWGQHRSRRTTYAAGPNRSALTAMLSVEFNAAPIGF